MEHATLDHRDGWLCAREESLLDSEPVKLVQWWPLIRDYRRNWEEDLGQPLYYHGGSHSYSLKIAGFYRDFRLPQGGQTHSIAFERVPVEPPKRVRLPLRWRYGRWEKETAKGWVAA